MDNDDDNPQLISNTVNLRVRQIQFTPEGKLTVSNSIVVSSRKHLVVPPSSHHITLSHGQMLRSHHWRRNIRYSQSSSGDMVHGHAIIIDSSSPHTPSRLKRRLPRV